MQWYESPFVRRVTWAVLAVGAVVAGTALGEDTAEAVRRLLDVGGGVMGMRALTAPAKDEMD